MGQIFFNGASHLSAGREAVAVGAALEESTQKKGTVALSFFGGGSTNTGALHEAMNMASVLNVTLMNARF